MHSNIKTIVLKWLAACLTVCLCVGMACVPGFGADISSGTASFSSDNTVLLGEGEASDQISQYSKIAKTLTVGGSTKLSAPKDMVANEYYQSYYCVFKFTPTVSGNYTLTVGDPMQSTCTLYNASGDYLSTSGNYYDKSSYNMTYKLTAKTTYYYVLEVSDVDSYSSRNVTVSFKCADKPALAKAGTTITMFRQKSKTLKMVNTALISSKGVTYTSSNTSVATVSSKGVVKTNLIGSTIITVSGTTIFGTKFSSKCTIVVSKPVLQASTLSYNVHNVAKNSAGYFRTYSYIDDTSSPTIVIKGLIKSSSVTIQSVSSKKLKVYQTTNKKKKIRTFAFQAKKKGNYTVTFLADGKKLTAHINIINAYFSRNSKSCADGNASTWSASDTMLALYPGDYATLTAKGLGTGLKWSSSDKKVATVDSTGKVTGVGSGYCTITASKNGGSVSYKVGVASKTAICALRYAVQHYGSTYSQGRRMEEGYYDCSSFCFRAYRDAGYIIGSSYSYAPTAADMAKWCTSKGYIIASGTVKVADLLPGDLIFECGASNGRYLGIYHVDMYQGNYSSITVANQKSYSTYLSNVVVARPCP